MPVGQKRQFEELAAKDKERYDREVCLVFIFRLKICLYCVEFENFDVHTFSLYLLFKKFSR